jgi:hypothetical protein
MSSNPLQGVNESVSFYSLQPVYRSSKDDPHVTPLDAPAVWRYTAKDALQSPGVPAVEVFRKLIAESEKQLAGTP